MRQLAGGQDGQVRPLPGMREFSRLQLYPEDSVQRGTEQKRLRVIRLQARTSRQSCQCCRIILQHVNDDKVTVDGFRVIAHEAGHIFNYEDPNGYYHADCTGGAIMCEQHGGIDFEKLEAARRGLGITGEGEAGQKHITIPPSAVACWVSTTDSRDSNARSSQHVLSV